MITSFFSFLEYLSMKCWWVILFCLITFFFYEQGRKKIDLEYVKLHNYLNKLQVMKEEKLKEQDDLMLKINSQSDPDYVELLLMRELGVVPEGQTKFFFVQEEKN